jgi:pimeloyl-ACP methyl ester carboxylesterase
MIPPSITLIVFGTLANASIGDMMIGTLIPGLIACLIYCLTGYIIIRREGMATNQVKPEKGILASFLDGFWALITPLIILGGIYTGVFSPTESAAAACLYALIIGWLVYKELNFKAIYQALLNAFLSMSSIMFLIACATFFGWVLTMEGIPQYITSALMDTVTNKYVLLLMDKLGLSSAYLVGSLVGANICARLAAQYPQRVTGLLLAHVCYHPDPTFYPNLRHADCFQQKPPMADGSHLQQLWEKAARYGESPEVTDVRVSYMHLAGPFVESMHWALCDDADFGSCLPRIKAPTVVAAFGNPPAGPMPEEAAKVIPGAQFTVMEGCSPLVTILAPEKFAALFSRYFD